MCPEVKMSEVHFLEPLDDNGERDDEEAVQLEDGEAKTDANPDTVGAAAATDDKLNIEGEGALVSEDEEEPSDPNQAKKLDDENMQCATEKILRKIQQSKDKSKFKDGAKGGSMMIDDQLITPEMFATVDKRTQKKLRRHLNDEE